MELKALKSWYTHREGWVTLEDDVLSIVRQVRELFGSRITVELNPYDGMYSFVEHCVDGVDRLVFTTPELDGRCIERLYRSDSQARGYLDPYNAAESEQAEAHRRIDEYYKGYIGEAGAHLAVAMKREGKMPRLPLTRSMHVPEKKNDA